MPTDTPPQGSPSDPLNPAPTGSSRLPILPIDDALVAVATEDKKLLVDDIGAFLIEE